MKKTFALAVVVFVIAFSVAAMAADGTTKIKISSPVQLDGKQIAPGEYQVKWSGNNDDLQVTIAAGKKDVVTTKAKLVEHDKPAPYAALILDKGSLKEIWMGNKKEAIVFAKN